VSICQQHACLLQVQLKKTPKPSKTKTRQK
jgi:hypothetical protein